LLLSFAFLQVLLFPPLRWKNRETCSLVVRQIFLCRSWIFATIAMIPTVLPDWDLATYPDFQTVTTSRLFVTIENHPGITTLTTTINPFFIFNTIESTVIPNSGGLVVRVHLDDSARVNPDAF
jgi:hypothetical protein